MNVTYNEKKKKPNHMINKLPAWHNQIGHFFKFHLSQENGSCLLQSNIKLKSCEDFYVISTL